MRDPYTAPEIDPSLVGREPELERLEANLEAIAGGDCRITAVSGEPGIGKTRLLGELCRTASDRGYLVLSGSGAEFERDLPFAPLVDACDDYLASLGARRLQLLGGEELADLATIFPSLESLAPAGAVRLVDERYRAHRAVRELLERLAASAPLVLVLDDLHWADAATAELVGHLLRRPPQAAVGLVLAHRSGQLAAGLAAAIESAGAERLELPPLTAEQAGSLMEGVAAGARDAVYRESGGNPFYLAELARFADRAGDGSGGGARDAAGVPNAVHSAIGRELDALPDAPRELAEAAAVAGDPFELDLAIAVAAMREDAALDAIDELQARMLVRPTDVPRCFRFRHPLVRAAVYESCSPGTRLRFHSRAAEALAGRGATAPARAHHVEASARPGDAEAIELLRAAGEAAVGSAPDAASRWYAAALRLMPEDDPSSRLEVLASLGLALRGAGRLNEARELILEAIDQLDPAATELRAAFTSQSAMIDVLMGRHDSGHRSLLDAFELAPPGSPEAVQCQLMLAISVTYVCDFPGTREWARSALSDAERLDHPPLRASAESTLALAYTQNGPTRDAIEYTDRAAAGLDAFEDQDVGAYLELVANLGTAELMLGRFDDSVRHTRRGIDIARTTGQGQFLPVLSAACARAVAATGALAEAEPLLDDAEDAARLAGSPFSLCWSLAWRGRLAHLRGDRDRAMAATEEGLDLALRQDQPLVTAWLATALGPLLVDAGQPDRAIALALEHGGGPELPRIGLMHRPEAYELLTLAALAAGGDADDWAGRAEAVAREIDSPVYAGHAARARASIAVAKGVPDRGPLDALAIAVAGAEELGAPVDAARTRLLAGRLLAATDSREEALAQLEAAESTLREAGAERYRLEATRELRKLGRSGYRRTRPGSEAGGVESLTARELELARLVVDRRTNAEIAAELFLSLKTVETHMRNIFRKLGVASRVEVARMVERGARGSG